jgi:hypothetical protein
MRIICETARDELRKVELMVRQGKDTLPANVNPEVAANAVLAIRHIEDARMRLGKVLQYLGDGVSCYDKRNKGDLV